MKLTDIAHTSSQELNSKMQAKLGWSVQLDKLSVTEANDMIASIDNKLNGVRRSNRLHESQNDKAYTGMLLARKVLESFIAEARVSEKAASKSQQQAAGAALAAKRGKAPKSGLKGASKSMMGMSKAELEKIAGTKHKGLPKHVGESRLTEDEVSQAESMMAAKDMVDSIQGMLEDVSRMLNEQLPPLTDNIRGTMGSEKADAFNSAATASLTTLLGSVQQARTSMDSAVRSMTGEAAPVAVPSMDAGDDMAADAGDEMDDLAADDFGASDAAAGGELPMGREKRA